MANGATPTEVRTMQRAFVLLLLAIFGYLSYRVFEPFLSYLFMGGLFVYLLRPLHVRLTRRLKRPRLSASLLLLVFAVALAGPLTWLGVQVAVTTTEAFEGFDPEATIQATDQALEDMATFFGMSPPAPGESVTLRVLEAALPDVQRRAEAALPSFVQFVGSFLLGLFVMSFVIFYGLVDGPRFVDFVRSLLPLRPEQASGLLNEVRRTVDAVFLGHIIVSIIQGTLGTIGFLVFGVPHALFWGFVMVLLALVPIIGPPIVWVPAVVYLFLQGETFMAVGLLVWCLLLVSTLDNVIRPKIVGTRADIHPVLVLVGVLGGAIAFGFIGLVLGPLVVSVLVAVLNFWRHDHLPGMAAPPST